MKDHNVDLLERYRTKGVLIDTNLLLMYFVGLLDVDQISKFKRTKQFSASDFYLLSNIINKVQNVITTPNILTEISNLSWQLPEHLLVKYTQFFTLGIKILKEHYLPSTEITQTEEFHRFGITDAGIFLSAKNKYLVITDDFRLSQYLISEKIDAINFNHIRSLSH